MMRLTDACSGKRARTSVSIMVLLILVAVACTDSQPHAERPPPLKLSAEGFGPVAIGDSLESVSAILSDRWGPPLTDREFHCESSAHRQLFWDGVLLVFDRAGLSGYQFGPKPEDAISPAGADIEAASTTEGLRLGARVGEAGEIYGPRFMLRETTLGPEWWIERPEGTPLLGGFATGLTDNDTITHIGAGDVCAVR